ncbi:hypothetical protein DUNSADRAFT_6536 [Dunaliella salina]|uniref:Uncharacterized protein n=1 Tax=Dunaliella salina TaxID=3046 RepID=A0ABQ7FUY0_DUNSA|nr:hypothetical protein DUNSADRAFT_6536 [Dunaliella salina]|eukprot:KAF5825837.1 hypothetical protein DUNSADRAFT_6536 [Dunaliella salina]
MLLPNSEIDCRVERRIDPKRFDAPPPNPPPALDDSVASPEDMDDTSADGGNDNGWRAWMIAVILWGVVVLCCCPLVVFALYRRRKRYKGESCDAKVHPLPDPGGGKMHEQEPHSPGAGQQSISIDHRTSKDGASQPEVASTDKVHSSSGSSSSSISSLLPSHPIDKSMPAGIFSPKAPVHAGTTHAHSAQADDASARNDSSSSSSWPPAPQTPPPALPGARSLRVDGRGMPQLPHLRPPQGLTPQPAARSSWDSNSSRPHSSYLPPATEPGSHSSSDNGSSMLRLPRFLPPRPAARSSWDGRSSSRPHPPQGPPAMEPGARSSWSDDNSGPRPPQLLPAFPGTRSALHCLRAPPPASTTRSSKSSTFATDSMGSSSPVTGPRPSPQVLLPAWPGTRSARGSMRVSPPVLPQWPSPPKTAPAAYNRRLQTGAALPTISVAESAEGLKSKVVINYL